MLLIVEEKRKDAKIRITLITFVTNPDIDFSSMSIISRFFKNSPFEMIGTE